MIVYVIQHIAGHKFSDGRNKILYCAPTNAAVDEMIRRLLVLNRKSDANARFDGIIQKTPLYFIYLINIDCYTTFSSSNWKLG